MWEPSENHQEHHNNPCIAAPFGAPSPPCDSKSRQQTENKKKVRSKSREESKRNVRHWLKLQELHHRIKDCEDEDEKAELYLSLGDRLCDVERFSEALCAYGQSFMFEKLDSEIDHDCFVYFMQKLCKAIESETMNQLRYKIKDPKKSQGKEEDDQRKYYTARAGDPCSDPLSCPQCSGVLCDPVTIACGHTFCRPHVTSNSGNPSLCYKCKAPWTKSMPVEEVKLIKTNTIVNNLVHKYWSNDLKIVEMRNEANKNFSSGKLSQALETYNQAFNMASNDHLILSNRSLTNLKMGNVQAALEDANLAVALRPDWAKGYLRRANALKTMGHHQEAFKAFLQCLILEGGSTKPIKQEVAKELVYLLKNAKVNKGQDSESSSLSDNHSSSNSLSSMSTFEIPDLPDCLRELGQYMDDLTMGGNDSNSDDFETNQDWLAVGQMQVQRPYREVDESKVDPTDFECPLCMRLLWKPITTPCGHTFCESCLDRVMDHNTTCPLCKSSTLEKVLADRAKMSSTEFLEDVMKRFLPKDYEERRKIHETEMEQLVGSRDDVNTSQVPIFVCTMGFPCVPCPLHVFEPRYRLMIRRCMELGTREFGMCCYVSNNSPFADYGTMLEIRDIQFFPDGRSIVDTMGGRRFKVLERGIQDGYNTAKVEFLHDDPVPESELQDLIKLHDETLQQTKNWYQGQESVVQKKIVEHYGKLPDTEQDYWTLPSGPSWSWWILNILPFDSSHKIKLLAMTSLKGRLEKTRSILSFLEKARKPTTNN